MGERRWQKLQLKIESTLGKAVDPHEWPPPARARRGYHPVPYALRTTMLQVEFPTLPAEVEAALADEICALVERTVRAQTDGFADGEPPRHVAPATASGK